MIDGSIRVDGRFRQAVASIRRAAVTTGTP